MRPIKIDAPFLPLNAESCFLQFREPGPLNGIKIIGNCMQSPAGSTGTTLAPPPFQALQYHLPSDQA